MALPPGADVSLPEIDFLIDNAANEQDVHAGLRKVCKALLKAWENIPDTDLMISVVSGGISNALYKVSTSTSKTTSEPASSQPSSQETQEGDNLNAVVVRVYGIGTEKFVDRERECKVMTLLHHHGFGAGLLGLFTNGRIESYLDLRPLNPEEMAAPHYATAVAATLARFHAVGADAAPVSPATPFGRIREWMNVARGLDFSDDPQKAETFASFNFDDMSLEIDRVEKAALAANSPTVFGHNDLLSGNILVPTETSSLNNTPPTAANGLLAAAAAADDASTSDAQNLNNLTFIDFEYSDWTPRGFDWGNHFCEYAGFECDYGKYPDSEVAGKLKTVNVTLWGDSAEKEGTPLQNLLEAGQFPVVAISNCRVSSYNGISVSAVMRSKVVHEADSSIPEMIKLKEWYAASGHAQNTSAVGEGLATASKAQGPRERLDLSGVRAAAPPTPETKPVYSTVSAAVAAINPDQSLYYLACPENNRKVTEQGPGSFYCEYDGKTYPSATRRYIMTARLTDGSGELPVQVFNDQAEALLGRSADDLHALRETAPATFKALLQEAAWTEWVLRVKAQAQEYNGEVRQRYAVAEISPIDYSTETRRTLDLIAGTA